MKRSLWIRLKLQYHRALIGAAAVWVTWARLSATSSLETWHVRTSPSSETLEGVAYGAGQFVAVGENGAILGSPDGSIWSIIESPTKKRLDDVIYAQGLFVA